MVDQFNDRTELQMLVNSCNVGNSKLIVTLQTQLKCLSLPPFCREQQRPRVDEHAQDSFRGVGTLIRLDVTR